MRPSVREKLGPYEILAPFGGGCDLYRAHDFRQNLMSRSNRDVAIKVSNAQFNERRRGSFLS
jgi:hypothetical protein